MNKTASHLVLMLTIPVAASAGGYLVAGAENERCRMDPAAIIRPGYLDACRPQPVSKTEKAASGYPLDSAGHYL